MSEQPMNKQNDSEQQPRKESIGSVVLGTIKSVLMAFLGVQSKKNWEKDLEAPSPLRFIFGGLILGFLFFATVFVVTWVISTHIV